MLEGLKRFGNAKENLKVLIYVESRYKIDRKRTKSAIANLLDQQGIHSPVEVSIAIVGDRKMKTLSKKYKGEDRTRNILSFSLTEGEKMALPPGVMSLGDIVISYPIARLEAARDEMLVDDKIEELVLHGMTHLLGIHHE